MPPPPRQQYGPTGANVFIFHLPQSFTEDDLRGLFQPYGTIISCRLFLDRVTGRSKCFGFVSYEQSGSAQAAIVSLNGYQVGNYRLKVQLKAGDGEQPAYKPPVPRSTTQPHTTTTTFQNQLQSTASSMDYFQHQQQQQQQSMQPQQYADPSWCGGYTSTDPGAQMASMMPTQSWYPNYGLSMPSTYGVTNSLNPLASPELWYNAYLAAAAAAAAATTPSPPPISMGFGSPPPQQQIAQAAPPPILPNAPTTDWNQYSDILGMLATSMSSSNQPPSLADWYAYADALAAFSNSLRAATTSAAVAVQQQTQQPLLRPTLPETPPLVPTDPAIIPAEPPATTAPGNTTRTYSDPKQGSRGYQAPVLEGDWL
jgi:hypothetical protein